MTTDTSSLESLFGEAKKAFTVPRGRGVESNRMPKPAGALYTDPANWTAGTYIALMHKETQTLLGTFQEYLHRSVADCRRLVRVEGPVSVARVEEVAGTWGWTPPLVTSSSTQPQALTITVPLELQSPPLICGIVPVTVHLQGAGLLSIRLVTDTQFADVTGQEFLSLPAGTNLLPVLSLETKKQIRQEISL